MEQGASLHLHGDMLSVTPRSDIYIRYLTDNRNVIGELASELYGRRIKVEITPVGLSPSTVAAGPTSEVAEAAVSASAAVFEKVEDSGVSPAPIGLSGTSRTAAEPAPDSSGNGSAAARSPQASVTSASRLTQIDARQKLYADPLVQRIFQEFDARLVELKTPKGKSEE
jgi:hypothetical protein